MTTSSADLAVIDVFEKVRAHLLECDPGLETGALARPADKSAWMRLSPKEYQEAFLSVFLKIDRFTAAGRRAVRQHLRTVRDLEARGERAGVSEKSEQDLFQRSVAEKQLRDHFGAVCKALESLSADGGDGPPPVVAEAARCSVRRKAVRLVRKVTPLFSGLRVFEFLAQIGYPIVVPDAARRRLFHRLGWVESVGGGQIYPQRFFEVCDRVAHLTGEREPVLNAAFGLFAGSRDMRGASAEPVDVCGARPRCGPCPLGGQCSYRRYRGEAKPAQPRTVKSMAHAEQPRTRFEVSGPSNLTEVELLALVVRTGAEGKSSLDLAREIIGQFGSLEAIARAGMGELCKIKGVGRAKAIEIQAALELGRRLMGVSVPVGKPVRRSADVFEMYRPMLANEEQENFYLLVVDVRNRIQKHFLISRGGLTGTQVHPREVIKKAVREAAAAVVFLHNHPSGETDPSQDDRDITKRLVDAAQLLGIRVLDHIIIGRDNYFSFADHGLL